jgi:hypothetical protein
MNKCVLAVFAVVVLAALCCTQPVSAGTKTLNFAWEQPGSLVGFAGWKLYQSDTAGGPGTVSMTIPYGGASQSTYTGTKVLTSPDGVTKTYYFTLSAFDTSGNESAKSNEVSAVIDFEAPGVPLNLQVTITTP